MLPKRRVLETFISFHESFWRHASFRTRKAALSPCQLRRVLEGAGPQEWLTADLSVTPPSTAFLSLFHSFADFREAFIPVHMERQRSSNGPRSQEVTRSGILRVKPL